LVADSTTTCIEASPIRLDKGNPAAIFFFWQQAQSSLIAPVPIPELIFANLPQTQLCDDAS
jgi:hypothetical protein